MTWPVRETPLESAADKRRHRTASHATRIHIRVLISTRRQRGRKIILREEDREWRYNAGLTELKHQAHSRTSSRNFLSYPALTSRPPTLDASSVVLDVQRFYKDERVVIRATVFCDRSDMIIYRRILFFLF